MSKAMRPPPPTIKLVRENDLGKQSLREVLRDRLEQEHVRLHAGVTAIAVKSGIRDPGEIADLLGEVVRQVLEQAPKYDPNRPVLPWAISFMPLIIAHRRREQALQLREIPATDLGPETDRVFEQLQRASEAASVGERLDLHDWLEQLNPQDRRVLQLRYFQGITGAELAREIGASEATSRVRLCRATARLTQIASRSEGGDS